MTGVTADNKVAKNVSLGLLFLGRRPPSRFVDVARLCDQVGFDDFWIPDERFFREVYSLCTSVATSTERLRVGPCVTDPYTRHPSLTAMAIATLDEISHGRAILGFGAGISGFAEMSIERRNPAKRTREAIMLIRALLTGVQVDLDGDLISFHGRLDFTPPRSDVPLYLAAAGPNMLRLAGEMAQGVIVEGCVAPGTLEAALAHVKRGLDATGRDVSSIDVVARIDVAVEDRLEDAYDVLRHRIARHLVSNAPSFERFTSRGITIPDEVRALLSGSRYTHDPEILNPIGALATHEMIDGFCIAATPETLPDQFDALVNRGATQILVNPIAMNDVVEPVIEAAAAWKRARSAT
jgi:5,10-methylenetetrahydromethanopterin reductase